MTNAEGNLAVYVRYPENDFDINCDGDSSGLSPAPNLGNVVKIQHPAVRELIPNTGSGDPWVWNTQNRFELFMNNLRGQQTVHIGADGSIDLDIRYPENDPEGAGQFVTTTLSNSQYGFIKEKHVDVDPALVMTLLGPDADLVAFTAGVSPIVPRTGTGPYLDLVTSFQPSNRGTGCTGCAYDPTGAPLQMTDPRLKTTRFERNELGEAYRIVGPAPYYYATEMWFDANRNTTRVDKKDLLVQFDSDNPADPRYGRFTPSGSATDADLPVRPGPGGSIRPGWFTDLAVFDLLNQKFETDTDATGSWPSSLVTQTAFDFNQNPITITSPLQKTIEMDYDERDLKIATRVGGPGGSVTLNVFDGNKNLTDTIGPAIRGTPDQTLTAVIADAFRGGESQTFSGDWGDITTDHLGYDGTGRMIGKRHKLPSGATLVGFTTQYDPSSNKLFERALHAESRSSVYAMDSMDRLLAYLRGVVVPAVSDGWSGMTVDDWAGLTVGGWASLAVGGSAPPYAVESPITLPNTFSQRSYALDGLGNWRNTGLTPVGGSAQLELRTHNKLNQITAFGVAPASTPVTYDNGNNVAPTATRGNGNIANDGTRAYIWDALNRLINVNRTSDGQTVGAYLYDAVGRRVQRIVSNGGVTGDLPDSTSRYLLSGQQIVEELDGGGSTTVQYVWGQYVDELIELYALVAAGPQSLTGKCYLLSDLLYRSAALTNSAGAIVEAYDTDAYGETLLFVGPGTDGIWFTDDDVQATYSACRYVFTGREWDAETRLYCYRMRYYSPQIGRFAQRDPLEPVAHGIKLLEPDNLYLFVLAAPAMKLDPSGAHPFLELFYSAIDPIDARRAYNCAQWAYMTSDAKGHAGLVIGRHNGAWDALRHCLWNCCMAQKIGAYGAQNFADAHETGEGYSAGESPMDLYNNAVGRRLCTEKPDVNCEDGCMKALRDGKLVVLQFNNDDVRFDKPSPLYPSNGASAAPVLAPASAKYDGHYFPPQVAPGQQSVFVPPNNPYSAGG